VIRVRPKKIELNKIERKILDRWKQGRKCSCGLSERAQIILHWSSEIGPGASAKLLGVNVQRVLRWRERWYRASKDWKPLQEQWTHCILRNKMEACFADAPRSGAPTTFTAQEVCKIFSIACQPPKDLNVPVSHWSASDLRREVLKQGVVKSISSRTISRFLKRLTSSPTVCATG
jgi:hypothetical protein